MKECPRCHKFFPLSEFYIDRAKRDGLRSYCKKCSREHNIQYHQKRLENNLCYDCGNPLPEEWETKRFCPICYHKRLILNEKYEKQRVARGLCRQCGKNNIDYSRSKLHCSDCLDIRREGQSKQ